MRELGGPNRSTRLSPEQRTVLLGLMAGSTLKSHRFLDGRKEYRLHSLDALIQGVDARVVRQLHEHGLIHSNQKFPAATYLLTAKGLELAKRLAHSTTQPLTSRHFLDASSPQND